MGSVNQKIGVGVIGTGFGKIVHIPGLQAHPEIEVVAVYNRDLAKAQQVAAEFGIANSCDRLADLLALPTVDAVTIATPPFLHYEQAKAAIAAGKHVLLEKPTSLNVAEAVELYRLAQTQRVTAAMDFEFRFVPQWRYFKHLLEQDYVGQKRLITINWLVQGRANPSRGWSWYSQKSLGGGALGSLGSHTFDYVSWLFGDVQRLCGQLSTSVTQRPDSEGKLRLVDSDDNFNVLMELADGTPCNICVSTVAYRGRGHWITVYGDRGTLVLGSPNQADYIHGFTIQQGKPNKDELEVLPTPPTYDLSKTYKDGRLAPFIGVCDHFVKAIAQGTPMIPSLREGVYSQLLMDLTHQSYTQGCWVDVPNLENIL